MHRFHCPAEPAPGRNLELDEPESRHALRVLRLVPGDRVEVTDGMGGMGQGTLIAAGRQQAVVHIDRAWQVPPPPLSLDLAVALPKGGRVEDLVDQLSQLGAARLIPLRTHRTVVDPRPAKLQRLQRRAVEAAKQCGRAYMLVVEPTQTLPQVLTRPHSLRLLADPAAAPSDRYGSPGTRAPLHGVTTGAVCSAVVLIGPEGGWTDEERQAALAAGCTPCRLGPYVMRIETAAAAAAAIIGYLSAQAQSPAGPLPPAPESPAQT